METAVRKTSEEWAKSYPMVIKDPDGWDRGNFDYAWYQEMITEAEFVLRAAISTTVPRGMNIALLYKKISEWAAGVFGTDREASSISLKLRKEALELDKIVMGVEKQWHPREEAYSEIADCVILLMNLGDRLGLDWKGFVQIVESKFEIVQERTWDKEADGTYQHREKLADEDIKSRMQNSLPDPAHRCTICHVNWVDSDNGFDTCQNCLNRVQDGFAAE